MKQSSLLVALLIVVVVIVATLVATKKLTLPGDNNVVTPPATSSIKDAIYVIDNRPVTLVAGKNEEAISDSSSKMVTSYFGNEVVGDFNHDGLADVAFLITQTTGGSGTFYYLTVALGTAQGYHGTNAVLLGDRIAPQTTEWRDGAIVANFADRKPNEPMTAQPSVGVSKYFVVSSDGTLTSK